VIFKEERVGGRARVTIDEERVIMHISLSHTKQYNTPTNGQC